MSAPSLQTALAEPLTSALFRMGVERKLRERCRASTLARWNRSGARCPCPFCGSEGGRDYRTVRLADDIVGLVDCGYGIFDKDQDTLALCFGTALPAWLWRGARETYLRRARAAIGQAELLISYLRCPACDLVYQNYPHEEAFLDLYYSAWYRRNADGAFGRAASREAPFARWKALEARELVRSTGLPAGSRVLDVGSAEGCFCLGMNDLGMEAHGVEPSGPMVQWAREVLGLPRMQHAPYSTAACPPGSFDAVHSFHVLEHLLDIRSALAAMHYHLRSGGWLLLSVPSVDLAREPEDDARILLNTHLYCFSERWLRDRLAELGFEIVETRLTAFCLDVYGAANPGREFGASPWGDVPGGIYVFARKTGGVP
jgi:2-polyprenyl-3-methyl-5-hydroxy-6-metoxy-1,4-benzoquinol methylase